MCVYNIDKRGAIQHPKDREPKMKTYKTLDQAREAKTTEVVKIIEIEHATEGRCFIGCKVPMAVLAGALKRKPMPEIKRLVAEYTTETDAEIEEIKAKALENCRCERCGVKVNGKTAYSQKEWANFCGKRVQVTACYCNSCRQLLTTIGAGEVTPMEERATEKPSHEPAYKGEADA
jgi:hypothetical protein